MAHADDHGEHQNDDSAHHTTSGKAPKTQMMGIRTKYSTKMLFDPADSVGGRDPLNTSATSEPGNDYSTVQLSSSSDSSTSSNFISSYNRRDMLDEIEETFNITNLSSINNSFRPTSQLDDFFSITLDEFRNLTMNNIADDSSSDENNEDDDAVHFPEDNSNFNENPTASRH